MHSGDRTQLGWLPLQHHDSTVVVPQRLVPGAARLLHYDTENRPVYDYPGGVYGAALWQRVDANAVHAWFLTGAPVTQTKGGKQPPQGTQTATQSQGSWLLLKASDSPDDRLEAKSPATPGWFRGEFPKAHTGQASAGTEEYSQEDLLHPDWLALYAPQAAESAEAGSMVYDFAADGSPDRDRSAWLQQLVRVRDLGPGACGYDGMTLALQLDKDDLRDWSGGLPFAQGKETGLGVWKAGGPFVVNDGTCSHPPVAGPDGPIRPLHASTKTLFLGLERDAPLLFEPAEMNPRNDPGIWQRVHLRFDKSLGNHTAGCFSAPGYWAWEVALPHLVDDPRQPPDPDPPAGDPFPPGDDPPPVGDPGGGPDTGLLFNPSPPKPVRGLVADGFAPATAKSPYTQAVPAIDFKAGNQVKGLGLPHSDLTNWCDFGPHVGTMSAIGVASSGDVRDMDATDVTPYNVPDGDGVVLFHPSDIRADAILRGESSSRTARLGFQTGMSELAFGTFDGTVADPKSGWTQAMAAAGLLFSLYDSAGVATGAQVAFNSGQISASDGTGNGILDMTAVSAERTWTFPDKDGTVAMTSDITGGTIGGSTGGTDNAVLRADGTGGSTLQATSVIIDDSDNVTGLNTLQIGDGTGSTAAGDLTMGSSGSGTRWEWDQSDGEQTILRETGTTNSALSTLALRLDCTNTVTNGFGPAIDFYADTPLAAPVYQIGAIETIYNGNTGGLPISYMRFLVRDSGATLGDGLRIVGNRNVIEAPQDWGFAVEKPASGDAAYTTTATRGVYSVDSSGNPRFQDGTNAAVTLQTFDGTAPSSVNEALVIDESGSLTARDIGIVQTTSSGGQFAVQHAETTLSGSGASLTATNLIPAGANLLDLHCVVSVADGGGGSATGYNAGDGSDVDRYGVGSALTLNTSTTRADFTVAGEELGKLYTSATSVVLTAVGGTFDTISINVTAFYTVPTVASF